MAEILRQEWKNKQCVYWNRSHPFLLRSRRPCSANSAVIKNSKSKAMADKKIRPLWGEVTSGLFGEVLRRGG